MISTVVGYIRKIQQQHKAWDSPMYVWFRGEPESEIPLLPKLYRPKSDGCFHHENKLLQMFRMRASAYSDLDIPDRGHTDQWLFLAQHVGLPTRLLDWTENSLLALYFAIKQERPLVWMLNPLGLNKLSISSAIKDKIEQNEEFPLTWIKSDINIGSENIDGAWELDGPGIKLPVAVHPTYLHPRMSAQRSVFTVHGKVKKPICDQVSSNILVQFIINPNARVNISNALKTLGVEEAAAFPDLDGLAKELSKRY